MAMSPEVIQALQRNRAPGGAAPPPGGPGPAGQGGMMPQKPAGAIEAGKLKIKTAMKLCEIALTSFEQGSKEWKTALAMITAGARTFGKTEGDVGDLENSEKKNVAAALPGPGGGPPQAGAPPPGAPPPQQAPPGGGAPQMAG